MANSNIPLRSFQDFKAGIVPHLKNFTVSHQEGFLLSLYSLAISTLESEYVHGSYRAEAKRLHKAIIQHRQIGTQIRDALTSVKRARKSSAGVEREIISKIEQVENTLELVLRHLRWIEKEQLSGMMHPKLRDEKESQTKAKHPVEHAPGAPRLTRAGIKYWFIERVDTLLDQFVASGSKKFTGVARHKLISQIFEAAFTVNWRVAEDDIKTVLHRIE